MMRRSFMCCAGVASGFPKPLRDIPRTRSWSFEQPTLTRHGRYATRAAWAESDAHFTAHMFAEFPALQKLRSPEIAISGGSIMSVLRDGRPNDLDFYVLTDPAKSNGDEAADMRHVQNAAEKFLSEIVAFTTKYAGDKAKLDFEAKKKRKNKGDDRRVDDDVDTDTSSAAYRQFKQAAINKALDELVAVRSGRVITILNIPTLDCPIQLTLVPKTIDKLLTESDVDTGAVVWTPGSGDLHFSEQSAFALQNFSTVIRLDHVVHPRRLKKFFDDGYDIILPELDVSKIPRINSKILKLTDNFTLAGGDLFVDCQEIIGNRINVKDIRYLPPALRDNTQDTPVVGRMEETAAAHDPIADSESGEWYHAKLEMVGAGSAVDSDAGALRRRMGMKRAKRAPSTSGGRYQRGEAIRAANHNVGEMLHGGGHFKYVQSGRSIPLLADPSLLPLADRTVDSVVNNVRRQLQKEFTNGSVDQIMRMMIQYCEPAELQSLTKKMLVDGPALRDRSRFKVHAEKVLTDWAEATTVRGKQLLATMAAERKKLPLDAQFGDIPEKHDMPLEAFYGSLRTKVAAA